MAEKHTESLDYKPKPKAEVRHAARTGHPVGRVLVVRQNDRPHNVLIHDLALE